MRWAMRVLLALVVLWSLWWWGAGYAFRSGIDDWFAARSAENWQADYADLSTSGFPLRHITRLTSPALADPETGTAWQADSLTFESPAIWPGHLMARFADTPQMLSYFDETVAVTATDMAADLVLRPGPALELERMALTSGAWEITAEDGAVAGADSLTLSMDQRDDRAAYAYDVTAEGFAPGATLRRILSGPDTLPDRFETLTAQMVVVFDRPWDRRALEDSRPQPVAIDLKRAELKWGALRLLAAGAFTIDAQGVPDGDLTLKAENWRDMLAMAEASGALPSEAVGPAERALSLLAGLGGNPNALDVKLNLKNGFVAVGPIPIGPAPRFYLR